MTFLGERLAITFSHPLIAFLGHTDLKICQAADSFWLGYQEISRPIQYGLKSGLLKQKARSQDCRIQNRVAMKNSKLQGADSLPIQPLEKK